MKTLVVAANNNEDTTWTKQVEGWTIEVYTNYHPSGREADTYLNWICQSYDDYLRHPDDEVTFCHGYPFDHDPNFTPHLSDPAIRYYGMTEHCDPVGMPRVEWCPLNCWCQMLGLPVQTRYHFVAGAQYRLTREQIQSRSLDFYKCLYYLTKIQENREAKDFAGWNVPESRSAYVLERIWPLIWDVKL